MQSSPRVGKQNTPTSQRDWLWHVADGPLRPACASRCQVTQSCYLSPWLLPAIGETWSLVCIFWGVLQPIEIPKFNQISFLLSQSAGGRTAFLFHRERCGSKQASLRRCTSKVNFNSNVLHRVSIKTGNSHLNVRHIRDGRQPARSLTAARPRVN